MRLAVAIATSVFIALACNTIDAQPIAQWNETSHNFGSFHESKGDQSCRFVVTNTGDSALVIVRVQTSCGCTVAKYTTTAILPGEKGAVDVTYSPTGRPGTFEKAVWVYTNSSPSRTRLIIEGAVVGSPQSVKQSFPVDAGDLQFTSLILPLGELRKGQMMSNPITAYNSSNDTLSLSFDNNTSHITCQAIPDTIPPGHISTISFFFNTLSTPVWGINDDNITLISSPLHSDRAPSKINVNVVANVVEDFSKITDEQRATAPECSIEPEKLVMHINKNNDKSAEGYITVKNTGKSNLIVRRAMSSDKALWVKSDKTLVKPGGKATVTVRVNPARVDGNVLNSQITLITNDPASPHLTVRVVGEIQ